MTTEEIIEQQKNVIKKPVVKSIKKEVEKVVPNIVKETIHITSLTPDLIRLCNEYKSILTRTGQTQLKRDDARKYKLHYAKLTNTYGEFLRVYNELYLVQFA